MMTPRCVALLPLLAVIGVARTAAEEPESQPSPTPSLLAGAFSLIATDGRYLAVDETLNAVTLVREEEVTSKLEVRWSALGAGKDRFYFRAGDLLLTALTNDEYRRRNKEQTEEEDGARKAQWRIHTREDGAIQLESHYGLFLRLSDSGVVEQGRGNHGKNSWWHLTQPPSKPFPTRPTGIVGGALWDLVEAVGVMPPPSPTHTHTADETAQADAPRGVATDATTGDVRQRRGGLRLPAVHATPLGIFRGSGWLVLGTTLALSGALDAPIGERAIRAAAGLLRRARLPASALERWGARATRAATGAIEGLRGGHPLGCLVFHGAVTDLTADLLAQGLEQSLTRGPSSRFAIDGARLLRSTAAAVVSDDVPFVLWVRALWHASSRFEHALERSALPLLAKRFLRHPLSLAVAKTLVSQLVFETASNALYLGLQALMRGDSVAHELRRKFWEAWRGGLLFFTGSHLIMFMLPFWGQVMVDNVACVAFNTYLAFISHAK